MNCGLMRTEYVFGSVHTTQQQPGHQTDFGFDIWIDGEFYKTGSDVLWICLAVSQLKLVQVKLEEQRSSRRESKHLVDIDLLRRAGSERRGDPTLRKQVLEKLISIALKYSSSSEKSVEVSLTDSLAEWLLTVNDYGMGMPKEDQKHVTIRD